MKRVNFILLILLTFAQMVFAQNISEKSEKNEKSFWLLSPRVGYDIVPMYKINQPYIDYKGGIMAGMSIDKYWNWIGIGADFDYIQNQPKSTYPTGFIAGPTGTVSGLSLSEEKITRLFYGIGPSFKYQTKDNKFLSELNLRAGMGQIKGGEVNLNSTSPGMINYHAGFDDHVFSAKGQLRFTYFFNPNLGVQIGGYYMRHFNVTERSMVGPKTPYSGYYRELIQDADVVVLGEPKFVDQQENIKISSIGAFVGLTFKINDKVKNKEPKLPEVCNTCDTYTLTVTAKDKYSHELLPNTSVVLKNELGEVERTGLTNEFGVVSFDNLKPKNFTVEGKLYNIALEGANVTASEFKPNEVLQKEILYSDLDFIILGNAYVCKTNEALPGASVILEGTDLNLSRSTVTDDKGNFVLHLSQMGNFKLFAKKDSYMSNIEMINPVNYKRERSLFVKLEICATEVNCESIRLDNIHYDLDKSNIRPDAEPELNKVVQFMKDNPTIRIELSSHTDSRASRAYNQKLSQRRADAAINYIISKGIERSRLVGKGYGEDRLLNGCSDGVACTEEQHQLNRRTEMRVICP